MTKPLGIYIHIPFCVSKCTYCNFYSFSCNDNLKNKYCNSLISEIKKWGAEISRPISSVYIGGGTPTSLGGEKLSAVLFAVNNCFNLMPDAEITVEGNPADDYTSIAPMLKNSGCNRFSLGLQTANLNELSLLGRRHTPEDVRKAIETLRTNGINNISVDLMLGLPESSIKTLKKSIDFALSLDVGHISAYILKIESGTPLSKVKNLTIPDDDIISDQYLFLCEKLENAGYEHYEISNFCKNSSYSRHNNSYWKCKEYLGLGPSAHSFLGGKRFYYPNDITAYINNPATVPDGNGSTMQEYIMLGLRLKNGISSNEFNLKFGVDLPDTIYKKAEKLQQNNLCDITDGRISLTNKGMLVSNTIINYFLEEL